MGKAKKAHKEHPPQEIKTSPELQAQAETVIGALLWLITPAANQDNDDESNEWLAPPEIIDALGFFDLDPRMVKNRPWDTAKRHIEIEENGLKRR